MAGGPGAIVDLNAPPRVPTALDSVKHPWPGIALTLSAVGAAIPVVALTLPHAGEREPAVTFTWLAMEVVTPAAGHLYAGLGQRALRGMTVRAVGFGIVAAGAANAGVFSSSNSSELTWGDLFMVLGGSIMAASAAWDVIRVPSDVEQRNADWLRTHARLETRMLTDGHAPALALTLRF